MKTLIIAPHADDETLGVGGTLLKRKTKKGISCTGWLQRTHKDLNIQKFIDKRLKQLKN